MAYKTYHNTPVEVCAICDIAGCHHIRQRMTDQQAPERIWDDNVKYVRADLLESAEKERDQLKVKNEELSGVIRAQNYDYDRAIAERDQALAASAAREIAMRDRAADMVETSTTTNYHQSNCIRALPLSPDGQQALDDVRAKAWKDGWEARARDNHFDTITPNPYRKG